jgi:hypothetical protein
MKIPRALVGVVSALVGAALAALAGLMEWRSSRRISGKAIILAFVGGQYGFAWLADKAGWVEEEREAAVTLLGAPGEIENVPITWRNPPRLPPQR